MVCIINTCVQKFVKFSGHFFQSRKYQVLARRSVVTMPEISKLGKCLSDREINTFVKTSSEIDVAHSLVVSLEDSIFP